MKLLNFAIGQVQTVKIGDQSVRTAYLKSPIPEPWVITAEGAQGDQRAVHPDKIYAYARASYDYWGKQLSIDSLKWPDGFFGENLTFDVLDEDELKIGDEFALGEAVRLVVAGPRNPCLKLSWRLGQPPTFQKIFQQSHHTGVYFGVLEPGVVRPGDVARRLTRDERMPTVVDTAQYAAGHSTPPLEPLRRLLGFSHLSGTIRYILQAKVHAAEQAAATSEGRWRGWRSFKIERIESETLEIRSFYLCAGDGKPLCAARPGQFVTVELVGSDGEAVTRCWSLSAFTPEAARYRITVRRQNGTGSRALHAARVGDTLRLRAPAGDFTLDTGSYRPVVLVAAGIGVTPLLAMLQGHLARGASAAPIYLVYGARTPQHVAFRNELDGLAATHAHCRVHYVYSNSQEGERAPTRVTSDVLMDILRDLHVMVGERRVALPWYENDTYLCGPGDFCGSMKQALIERGANPDHIFFELFSSALTDSSDLERAEILFARSGVTCTWSAEEDLSLLELGERAGVRIMSDCRAGACLSCKTPVSGGAVTSQMSDGTALLCIGRPKTAFVTLDC